MQNKIIFVGGIHGVGKGTLCKYLASKFGFHHLTASEVLKWSEISSTENKRVEDITFTQVRLIKNLKQIIKPNQKYLLDGHFTLLVKDGSIKKIEVEIFEKINPISIFILTADTSVILDRLNRRDKLNYNFEKITVMQDLELQHGKSISEKLNVPFFHIKDGELSTISQYLKDYENLN